MPNVTRTSPSRSDILHSWSVADSMEVYKVRQWGGGFFGINQKGHAAVSPRGSEGPALDLKDLVDELLERGIDMPILIRFSDILRTRIRQINEAFDKAFADHDYTGSYMGVYPIKVNQQRHVVEEIVRYGAPYRFGLEAGSKPELLAVLALLDSREPLIICNGYKDVEYIDIALWGHRPGQNLILVVEGFGELERILDRAAAFVAFVWSLACQCDLNVAKEVVLLGDGARCIWDHIGGLLPEATQIVDWYHAMEHVWDCGRVLYGENGEQTTAWVKQIETLLWDGHVREILQQLESQCCQARARRSARHLMN